MIKNKKAFAGVLLVILIIIGIIVIVPLLVSGGLAGFALNKIPIPVWILLAILLIFKFMGGKKR